MRCTRLCRLPTVTWGSTWPVCWRGADRKRAAGCSGGICAQALMRFSRWGLCARGLRGVPGTGTVRYEQDDLAGAQENIELAHEPGVKAGWTHILWRIHMLQAQICWDAGRYQRCRAGAVAVRPAAGAVPRGVGRAPGSCLPGAWRCWQATWRQQKPGLKTMKRWTRTRCCRCLKS
jgi:hypothetical protein